MIERGTFDKTIKEHVLLRILSYDSIKSNMADEVGSNYTIIKKWVKNINKVG